METPGRAADRQKRFPELREWKRKLQRAVDRLRDSFCRQHALDLIFNEDGEIRLTAEIYTSIIVNKNEADWFASPLFRLIQYIYGASVFKILWLMVIIIVCVFF